LTGLTAGPAAGPTAGPAKDQLGRLVRGPGLAVVPGAANALTTRIIEEVGFESAYVSGAAIANLFLGVPDIGLTSLPEVAAHVAAIRDACSIPLIVDADTGFGNAVNTWRTVRVLERAGADAIQLEDQGYPKRCGHFAGKWVIPVEEMVDKIQAAREARTDPGLLIIARTDARAEHGLAEALRRALAYHEAGADVLFVEAPQTVDEVEAIARELPGPLVHNVVEGGVTPEVPLPRVAELGYSVALFANISLLASIRATREVLAHLRHGSVGPRPLIATWTERQELVRKPWFDELADWFDSASLAADVRPAAS
jgi:2-methylisocitrate lyase-like PEP mutase family enzyme